MLQNIWFHWNNYFYFLKKISICSVVLVVFSTLSSAAYSEDWEPLYTKFVDKEFSVMYELQTTWSDGAQFSFQTEIVGLFENQDTLRGIWRVTNLINNRVYGPFDYRFSNGETRTTADGPVTLSRTSSGILVEQYDKSQNLIREIDVRLKSKTCSVKIKNLEYPGSADAKRVIKKQSCTILNRD